MSSNYYLYEASAPDLSEVDYRDGCIDADSITCNYYSTESSPEWLRQVGTPARVITSRVNMFAAGESMFGQRPVSISYASYDMNSCRLSFEDGSSEWVSNDDLEPYREDIEEETLLVELEEIGRIEGYLGENLAQFLEQELAAAALEDILRNYMNDYQAELEDSWGSSHYLEVVYVLTKAMLLAKDGAFIICEKS